MKITIFLKIRKLWKQKKKMSLILTKSQMQVLQAEEVKRIINEYYNFFILKY